MNERTYTHTELMDALQHLVKQTLNPPAYVEERIVKQAQAGTFATIMSLGTALGIDKIEFCRQAGVPETMLQGYMAIARSDEDEYAPH